MDADESDELLCGRVLKTVEELGSCVAAAVAGLTWSGRWSRDAKDRGFKSRPFRFLLTTLGKLFTRIYAFLLLSSTSWCM